MKYMTFVRQPGQDGVRMRIAKGKLTVIDGPFTEFEGESELRPMFAPREGP